MAGSIVLVEQRLIDTVAIEREPEAVVLSAEGQPKLLLVDPAMGPKGDPGPGVELRVFGTELQWRLSGDLDWRALVSLSEITTLIPTFTVAPINHVPHDTPPAVRLRKFGEADYLLEFDIPATPPPPNLGYTHLQDAPSARWVIEHPLLFTPNVSVVDSAGSSVEGDVTYTGPSTITIDFSVPFAGIAYLS